MSRNEFMFFLSLKMFLFSGTAALSLLTSGKYVIDPELRGIEFERITQNLDLQFWKSFWNLTESGLITVGTVKYTCVHCTVAERSPRPPPP